MPGIGSFQVLLGAASWDAVRYCRALTEDLYSPFVIPDEAYVAYHEDVLEDLSRWVPLDYQVGNPVLQTSNLLTVANQQRYVCSTGNGFTVPPARITDVLYRATNAFSAASEIAYLALLPFSPLNRFLFTPSLLDSPSERILRDEYLAELDKYGRGYYGVVRDPATGLLAIDLYPIPTVGGTPVYVRYQAQHAYTTNTLGDAVYATVPEANKRHFARLLYCMVLEQEQGRLAKATSTSAGILRGTSSPAALERKIERIRNEVYLQLGAAVPVVVHTF